MSIGIHNADRVRFTLTDAQWGIVKDTFSQDAARHPGGRELITDSRWRAGHVDGYAYGEPEDFSKTCSFAFRVRRRARRSRW